MTSSFIKIFNSGEMLIDRRTVDDVVEEEFTVAVGVLAGREGVVRREDQSPAIAIGRLRRRHRVAAIVRIPLMGHWTWIWHASNLKYFHEFCSFVIRCHELRILSSNPALFGLRYVRHRQYQTIKYLWQWADGLYLEADVVYEAVELSICVTPDGLEVIWTPVITLVLKSDNFTT